MEIGVDYNSKGESRFKVWAPFAENVELEFIAPRKRTVPLLNEDGYWETVVPDISPVEPGNIGVVAVVPGSGIAKIFASMGVGAIVEGGQTMNPSTEEIKLKFENLPTDKIIILPNNKNIFMAAKTLRLVGVGITAMGTTMSSRAFVPTEAICISPSIRRATINLSFPTSGCTGST